MEADVVPVLRASGIDRAAVRLWSAHYTGSPHICGPRSCRATSIDMDGTQWTNAALGRNLDESLLAADFFAAPAPPKPAPAPAPPSVPAWQEAMMNKLPVLAEGAADHAGAVCFVQRMQALVAAYGEVHRPRRRRLPGDDRHLRRDHQNRCRSGPGSRTGSPQMVLSDP